MWCDRILYNQSRPPNEPAHGKLVDYIDVDWQECTRVLKKRSRHGEEIRVFLPRDQRLKHGDIVHEDDERIIAVNVLPIAAVIAGPGSIPSLLTLVLELGNLHWPTQISGSQVIFPEHEPAMEVLRRLELPWMRDQLRFEPTAISSVLRVGLSDEIQVSRKCEHATAPAAFPPLPKDRARGREAFEEVSPTRR